MRSNMKSRIPKICFPFAFLLLYAISRAGDATNAEWLTWGGSPDRAGWAKSETTISPENASRLHLKWKLHLNVTPKFEVLSSATAPLVANAGARSVVFVVDANDTVYAIDAAKGQTIWKRSFENELQPKTAATYLCPNTQNATPVIDKEKGLLYVLNSDGKLRGLSLASGDDLMPPTDFVPPFSRTWSLNLIDGVIYTPVGRGCGGSVSHFAAMDVSSPERPKATFYTSTGRPAGAWGRGGLVQGPNGVYAQTADGPYDPAAGRFGNSVIALGPRDLRLVDSFTPADALHLNSKDLDLGSSSPVIFRSGKRDLLAVSSKQATIYLLDAKQLGGTDHRTPLYQARFGNDEEQLWGRGVWGSMSSWEEPSGQRWLIVPMWGPAAKDAPKFHYTYGEAPEGSLMAFQVTTENDKPALVPVWQSRDMHVPDPAVIANEVVLAVATGENTRQGGYFPAEVRAKPFGHATLYAFDALTGKELFSSGEDIQSFAHFGGLAVADGSVYFCTWDGNLYAYSVM